METTYNFIRNEWYNSLLVYDESISGKLHNTIKNLVISENNEYFVSLILILMITQPMAVQ